MKNIKYKVGYLDSISFLPENAIILNAKIVFKSDCCCLIYLPKKLKYKFEDEFFEDKGSYGSLSFACFDEKSGYWERSPDDYLNITLKKFEKK